MKIALISTSNVKGSGVNSISLQVCEKIKTKIEEMGIGTSRVFDSREYDFSPCIMCEACADTGKCIYDEGFNKLKEELREFDTYVLVVPHYALIPSKILMFMEKIEEIFYLDFCRQIDISGKLSGKRAAIVAHGGMTNGYADIYMRNIIEPLSYIFRAVGIEVINDNVLEPICFGVKGFDKSDKNIAFDIEYNQAAIDYAVDILAGALRK